MKYMSRLWAGLAAVGLLTAVGVQAQMMSPSEDVVSARKAIMKNIGASMKGARKMMGGEFNAATAAALGRTIHSGAGAYSHLFPEGTTGMGTTAAASIWSNPDRFRALADQLAEAGGAMAKAQSKADLGAAMQAAGATCKACHSDYRTE